MAGPGSVRVPPDSTGKIVDGRSLSVGGVTVIRQTVVIGDPTSSAGFATISAGRLQVATTGTLSLGAGTAHVGQVSVTGSVAISNPVTMMSLTGTASVVIGAGTNNIGAVSLGAGTAHIGQMSVTGSVAISNPVTLISLTGTASVVIGAGTQNIGAVSLAAGTSKVGFIGKISATTVVSGQVSVTGSVAISNPVTVVSLTGTATMLVGGFLDPSGQQRNVVDSANLALRVNVVAGAASATLVSLTGTATMVVGGFLDPSGTQRNVVDSVNTALRVNVVAGGAGGGIVFGANQDGASATAAAVLVGGRDSAGGGLVRTFLTDASGRLAVNVNGTVPVSGQVSVTGSVAISNPVTMMSLTGTASVVIGAGTNNIGAVSLAAGTAKVGFIGKISATAVIAGAVTFAAASAAVSINGTVAVSGNFSSTAVAICQGAVSHSAAVAIATNFPVLMGLRAGNSATVGVAHHNATFAWGDAFGRQVVIQNNPSALVSNSQGPRTVFASSSANVALVAAPAADFCIYVTHLMATNGSATLTRGEVYSGTNTASSEVKAYLAASGGGFTRDFNPPWKLQTATALNCRVEPNASKCLFEVHFYVAPK